jgi:hypothetical protein
VTEVHLFGRRPRRRSGNQGDPAMLDLLRFIAVCRTAAAREVAARAGEASNP